MKNVKECALCCVAISKHPIIDGTRSFCCVGCHAVFDILTAKNQLDGYSQHPIFIHALESGLISNPALLAHIEQQRSEIVGSERKKLYIEIGEMWCPSCAEVIRLMVLKERGVINCVVDYTTDLASIEFSPLHISNEQIFSVVAELGYKPIMLDNAAHKAVSNDLYLRFGVAAFCSLNIMMFAYPLYATYFNYDGEEYGSLFAWLSLIVSLPVLLYSAWPIWNRLLGALKTGFFGMEVLVAIGVGASFGLSLVDLLSGGTRVYFDSMVIIIFFMLLGKIIEARAKFSAKESLMRLTRETPRRARKHFSDGRMEFVLLKEIAKGDVLVAYTGEKISLDGLVVMGEGACDESLMTGEAMPVSKRVSDSLLGGTLLVQGYVEYRVSCSLNETALHQIIKMIEQDISHKSIYVRAADRIVRWFVPVVILIAIISGGFYWFFPASNDSDPERSAWLRALAVLLISCPCAIGIAAPAAESYLLNGLAAMGAIVRNRGALPFLGKEDVIIFDKTGTVTEGRFKVLSGIDSLTSKDKEALHNLASHSIHPVAYAIATATFECKKIEVALLEEVIGYGLRGEIEGKSYLLGSARFMGLQDIEIPDKLSRAAITSGVGSCVYFAKNGIFITQITLGDEVRSGVKELVAALKPAEVILLSGDAEKYVAAVASFCGFKNWKSGCTPLEKREFVNRLKEEGKIVSMLGDGINDASALTAAHVGISVISASDMSIQVSDLLLTTDRLEVLAEIRALAVKGQQIVRQNLFWAFFYNVIGILLASLGLLSPIFAAFAMSISSLTVLFNAHRLHKKITK